MIEVQNLTVRYGENVALENVSFRLKHPSLLAIIGPNGAGKTTLLRALLGLVDYEGHIEIFGKNPKEAREIVGYMPQRDNVNTNIPLRVKDVVLMPLLSRHHFKVLRESVKKAKRALGVVGLEDLWNEKFSSLSGGQQQRVFLARALARDAKVLILDEPFSATDVATKMRMTEILHQLKRDKTIILVTHDLNPLADCTDNVLLLNRRMVAYGRVMDVVTEENMGRLYGVAVPVIRGENVCYVMGSDVHVR